MRVENILSSRNNIIGYIIRDIPTICDITPNVGKFEIDRINTDGLDNKGCRVVEVGDERYELSIYQGITDENEVYLYAGIVLVYLLDDEYYNCLGLVESCKVTKAGIEWDNRNLGKFFSMEAVREQINDYIEKCVVDRWKQ